MLIVKYLTFYINRIDIISRNIYHKIPNTIFGVLKMNVINLISQNINHKTPITFQYVRKAIKSPQSNHCKHQLPEC